MAGVALNNIFGQQPVAQPKSQVGGVAVNNPFAPPPAPPKVVPPLQQQQQTATNQANTNIQTDAQKSLAAQQAQIAAEQLKSQQVFQAAQAQSQFGQAQTLQQQQAAAEAALQAARLQAGSTENTANNTFAGGQNSQAQAAAAALAAQQQKADQDAFNAKVAANNAASDKEFQRFQTLAGPFLSGGVPGSGGSTGGTTGDAADIAAQDAAFGRAKDRVGQISASGLQGLREAMASRGILGSGIEGAGMGELAAGGVNQLGEVARDQAITSYQEAGKRADRDVTKRGQDMGYIQSLLGLMKSGGSLY